MKKQVLLFVLILSFMQLSAQNAGVKKSAPHAGNPVFPGWYADPEATIFKNEFWIYPTYSDDYGKPDTSVSFTPQQLSIQ